MAIKKDSGKTERSARGPIIPRDGAFGQARADSGALEIEDGPFTDAIRLIVAKLRVEQHRY